jgi:hypothetical protein
MVPMFFTPPPMNESMKTLADLARFREAFPEESQEWPAILRSIRHTIGTNLRPAEFRAAAFSSRRPDCWPPGGAANEKP